MEVHQARQLRSLKLVQLILFHKLKLTILLNFTKHPTEGPRFNFHQILGFVQDVLWSIWRPKPFFLVSMLAKREY